MQYNITTKQGNNYIVDAESTWLWIEIERELGLTVTQAVEKISEGSLDVLTCMLYKAAKAQGKTQLPNQRVWVENEFEGFELVDDNPKENLQTDLSE
jgi:hypothetical protein